MPLKSHSHLEIVRAPGKSYKSGVWKLTGLDISVFYNVIRGIWIFDTLPDIELIKTSLSQLLAYYPHLSGRMEHGDTIRLDNSGILFIQAFEPELTKRDLLHDNRLAEYCSPVFNKSGMKRGTQAPLCIKLTKLKDGFVLGVKVSHSCLDGAGFYTMVCNWGMICRGEHILPPVLDQSLLPQISSRSKEEVRQAALTYGWKKLKFLSILKVSSLILSGKILERTRPFHIPETNLTSLKQSVSKAANCPCSTHIALSVFLTKMCLQLFGHPGDTLCRHVTVINARNRLPGITHAFAGNAAFNITTPPFRADSDVETIARLIHESLEPVLKHDSSRLFQMVSLAMDLVYHRISMLPFDFDTMHAKKPCLVYINNFSRLPIYNVNFGSEKPFAVIPHNLPDPVLIWPAPPHKGGVEVYFTGVPALVINKMPENDPWIQRILNSKNP